MALLGEQYAGAAQGVQDVVMITLGIIWIAESRSSCQGITIGIST